MGATRRTRARATVDAERDETKDDDDDVVAGEVEEEAGAEDDGGEDDVDDEDASSSDDDLDIELRDNIDVVAEHEAAEAAEAAEAEAKAAAEVEAERIAAETAAGQSGDDDAGEDANAAARLAAVDAVARGGASRRRAVTVYGLANYTFGTKHARGETDGSIAAKLLRMKAAYEKRGKRTSVGAICMVNQHHTPHVLLLQITPTSYKLPGGRLRAGEGDEDGLLRKLRNKLQPERDDGLAEYEFEVGDRVATWYRTAFEPQMYPYLPAHITKPKEELKLFVVQLPEKCYFAVPKNLKLLAVPIFELYANPTKYGAEIASIPHLLSNYRLQLD